MPDVRLPISCVFAPFDQSKEYEPEGLTDISILPLGLVQEVSGDAVPAISMFELPGSTVIDAEDVHPPASVTVTVYVPGAEMLMSAVDSPVFQLKPV